MKVIASETSRQMSRVAKQCAMPLYKLARRRDKKAYDMAIANKAYPNTSLAHHSDRAIQYSSSTF
jgi:hypothetical protein